MRRWLHALQDTYSRVAAECDGNPLFAELMLDVVAETEPGARIPPTIAALLSARLDQLPEGERQMVEMAAVIGRDFSRDPLLAMAAEEGTDAVTTGDLVTRLMRRRIVQRTDHGGLRFRQALLRDTAYALTPKTRRERRHLFLAERAREAGQRAEPEPGDVRHGSLEFAYHVEAACLLRRDLVPGSSDLPVVASAAADVLIDEGERALKRKDLPAAAALLERGRALLAPGDARRVPVTLHACDAWLGLSDEGRALATLPEAEPTPGATGRTEVTYTIQRLIVELRLGLAAPDAVAAAAEQVAGELHRVGDDLSRCRYHQLRAYLLLAQEQAAAADKSLRLALERARAIGDLYEEDRLLCAICEVAQWTPGHLDERLELCALLARRFAANRALLVPVLVTQAYLTALAGRLDDARHALGAARAYAHELHLDLADAAVLEMSGLVASLAGAHDEAEAHFRRAAAALRAAPRAPDAGAAEAAAARELFRQGRTEAASAALDRLVPDGGNGLSLRARIATTALRGRVASSRGRHDEAVALAERAHALSESVDDPCLVGEVLFDLAVICTRPDSPTARRGWRPRRSTDSPPRTPWCSLRK